MAAELLGSDYGGWGVALIVLFVLTRGADHARLIQTVGMLPICWMIGGRTVGIAVLRLPVELFGMVALIPIFCYSGEKRSQSRAAQWAFYLFYPVHLTILLLISSLL